MTNNELQPSGAVDQNNTTAEYRITRDTPIGTLVRLALEGANSDADNPQTYSVLASVTTKPITHALRLHLDSSEPPLPDDMLKRHQVFIDANPVTVDGVVHLKGKFGSDMHTPPLKVLSIVEEQEQ